MCYKNRTFSLANDMTISSTTRVAGPFSGDGTASTFPFAFKVFEDTDLYVATLDVAAGAIAVLTLDSDYSVTLNADQDTSPGGSVTLIATGVAGATLAAGYTLTVTTDMAALQGLDLTNGGGFYPDVINAALDTLTILVQQLQTQLGRTVQAPLVDAAPTMALPPAAERAGTVLMFDGNGNLTLVPMAPGGVVPGAQGAVGAVNGQNKVFTFQASAASAPAPLVFVGGVFQTPVIDYGAPVNTGGTTWEITFVNPPAAGRVSIVLLA